MFVVVRVFSHDSTLTCNKMTLINYTTTLNNKINKLTNQKDHIIAVFCVKKHTYNPDFIYCGLTLYVLFTVYELKRKQEMAMEVSTAH